MCWIVCASVGCAFTPPDSASGPDAGPDAAADPAPAAPAICDRRDPSLRLCVDFDEPIADRSASGAELAASAVTVMVRDGARAAALDEESSLHVRKAAALDLQGGLALDLWIRPQGVPDPGERFWILDNNQQYAASFTAAGAVRCVIGSFTVDSDPLPDDGLFHHVACTYDRMKLKVYVDGELSRCANVTIEIPTTGPSGLAIGANLSGSDTAPQFADRFIGGLDDVRVWARSDLDVCAAAGQTGCRTSCEAL